MNSYPFQIPSNYKGAISVIYGKYIVALCIPRIHEETNYQFITTLGSAVAKRGGRLMVYSTPSDLFFNVIDEQGEKTVFDLINYDITDAVVIHDEAIKDQQVVDKIGRASCRERV